MLATAYMLLNDSGFSHVAMWNLQFLGAHNVIEAVPASSRPLLHVLQIEYEVLDYATYSVADGLDSEGLTLRNKLNSSHKQISLPQNARTTPSATRPEIRVTFGFSVCFPGYGTE